MAEKRSIEGWQSTLVLLKPDAVQRRLAGRILTRFEEKGLQVRALKLMKVDRKRAARHYREHIGKHFYPDLIRFITAGPVVAMVVSGREAVKVVRTLTGPTFGPDAPAGTLRGDFGSSRRANLVHASDSPKSARREIALFFRKSEILDYPMTDMGWVYDRGV
ncbi:MAG: nucleoside-diphosphate kinase [Planctomycetota bacterium]